jgi:hypothetical protein
MNIEDCIAGQRVVVTSASGWGPDLGEEGVIVCIDTDADGVTTVLVDWGTWRRGHDGGGLSKHRDGRAWWVVPEGIEAVS